MNQNSNLELEARSGRARARCDAVRGMHAVDQKEAV